ncbi:MAG: zinc ribbon domain-containing protein [Oscillospiraceae bacterium]|nr:zinc ribbon domain-containing protein [Oscillospiraceae bacterium]
MVIPGGVPAIVPEDLFYRVQQRMEKNKRAPAHMKAKESEFLLTTKLFCGKCERMMVGESGKSHTGTMHYYYKCGNAKRKKGCDKKAVRKDWIERAVVRLTMERVLNEEKITRIIDALLAMQEQEDVTIPALRRQLAETEKGIENMLNAIQQGIFTASTKQRLEDLEKQKEELEISITTAEIQKPKLTREYMEHWFSLFRFGNPEDREFQKRLVDTFVNAVFVYDDKLVLTYNYQHGTQTITLKEVDDFLGSDLVGLSPPKKKRQPLVVSSFLVSPPQAAQPKGNSNARAK